MLFFFPSSCCLVWLTCTSVCFLGPLLNCSINSFRWVCVLWFPGELAHPPQAFLSAGDGSKFEMQNLICILLGPKVASCLLQPFGSLRLGHQSKNLIVCLALAVAVWSWWGWEQPWAHSCASRAAYLRAVCSRIWGASEALVKWAEVVLTVTASNPKLLLMLTWHSLPEVWTKHWSICDTLRARLVRLCVMNCSGGTAEAL